MSAGAFVFPITIGAFVFVLGGYLVTTPVQPNLSVDFGDQITIEVIEFYGSGSVGSTTQEEMVEAHKLPEFPYPPVIDPRPSWTVQMPEATDERNAGAVLRQFIGKREGETFDTAKSETPLYGNWRNQTAVAALTYAIPRLAILPGQPAAPYPRNFTTFVNDAKQEGHEVVPGEAFACEGRLWTCRIVQVNATAETIAFTREATERQVISIRELKRTGVVDRLFPSRFPVPDSTALVHRVTDEAIGVTFQFRTGDAFTILAPTSGWQPGGYKVLSSQAGGSYQVNYVPFGQSFPSPGRFNDFPAYLIGEPIWYRITVVKIEKPQATSPTP